MNKLFSGTKWNSVFVYFDSISIVSRSFEEHMKHIEKVLQYLDAAELKLTSTKCAFVQTKIDYLKHT